MADVLVTGGAGFIGSHVVEGLLANGCSVTVLDNLSTGRQANLPQHEKLTFVQGDIRDNAVVDKLVEKCDVVIHLAAVASVPASIADPIGTHEVNLVGTLNLLECARRHGGRRFIYASSAAVYGNTVNLPVAEDAPLNPLSPYAADKLAGEHYLGFYVREFGLSAVAFRFFNIYGPRQNPDSPYSGVISIFADRVRRSDTVTIHGDGHQTRDFVYVKDLSGLLVDTALSTSALQGQSLNVGRGTECSLLELLDTLEKGSGIEVNRKFDRARAGDIRRSCADPTRLRAFAGRVPATGLDVGLAELMNSLSR